MNEKTKKNKYPFPENIFVDAGIPMMDEKWLDRYMARQPERIRDMVYRYYRDKESLGQIGDTYYLTRERIRQLINKAILPMHRELDLYTQRILKYIPKSKLEAIRDAYKDSDGYWICLRKGWEASRTDRGCHVIHEDAIPQLQWQIAGIRKFQEEEES